MISLLAYVTRSTRKLRYRIIFRSMIEWNQLYRIVLVLYYVPGIIASNSDIEFSHRN